MKCISCVCLLASSLVFAQRTPFDLAAIPEKLKAGADVIVHSEDIIVEVENLDNATVKVRKIFTVLNEKGKNALVFAQHSNRVVLLDDAEIKVYDQNGKE